MEDTAVFPKAARVLNPIAIVQIGEEFRARRQWRIHNYALNPGRLCNNLSSDESHPWIRLRSHCSIPDPHGLSPCQSALVDHPRSFSGVSVRDVTFYSSSLGRSMTYRVYLPERVAADAKLSAVYLLHGCGTSFRDWSNDSDVGEYAAKGLVLVMVDGACSYYMNAALNPKDRYQVTSFTT